MPRRNVVVLLCDQLRPDFLSTYGCSAVPTPNLDRLAAEGVVFDQAITQSTVCAPVRASMMTGRYVSDHQVWTNDQPFRPGVEFIAERMGELGYVTGAFGKLHHYPAHDPKGFEHVALLEEGRLGADEGYLQWLKQRRPEVSRMWNSSGYQFLFSEEEYHEHWIASQAVEFLEAQASEQPFLAWISFQGPHGPLDPPREVYGTVDSAKLPRPILRHHDGSAVVQYRRAMEFFSSTSDDAMVQRTAYAEMIVEIDQQIGRILAKLEQLGLYENTTIIFSADHGDLLGDHDLNAKGPFPYRGQLDIPLIVANHPQVLPGSRSSSLVGNIDIPGTLLDIAGAKRGIGVSRSLIDQAQAEPQHPRQVNFSEFCDSIKTVENHRYRCSYYPFTGFVELYDKENDPDELSNLAGQKAYAAIELEFMKHIVDFGIVAKGVRIEAHDFVPEQQQGLKSKHIEYQHDFPVAFPLSRLDQQRLRQAQLDETINEFCRDKKVLRYYSKPYWQDPQQS